MENSTSRNQNRRTKINSPGKPDGSTVVNSEAKADGRTVVNRSSRDSASSPLCPPGTLLLDEFTVVSKLDVNSGEADLYICEDASRNNNFAAKIYRRHDALKDSILDRLTALRSDHIAPVLKFGTFNDFPCLILPYFKNGSLKGKRFSPEIIKGMIVPCLLDGLKFLHENNIP